MAPETLLLPFLLLLLLPSLLLAASPCPYRTQLQTANPNPAALATSKRNKGASDFVHLRYHMGPVLSSPIRVDLLLYGKWDPIHQSPIRDFLLSLSDRYSPPSPSISDWWATISLYADQTNANVSNSISIAGEFANPAASLGRSLTHLDIQRVITAAVTARRLPADNRGGVYLVLTAPRRSSAATAAVPLPRAAARRQLAPPFRACWRRYVARPSSQYRRRRRTKKKKKEG